MPEHHHDDHDHDAHGRGAGEHHGSGSAPAGAADEPGPAGASESGEHRAPDVAVWVSEFRRRYVEPKTRASRHVGRTRDAQPSAVDRPEFSARPSPVTTPGDGSARAASRADLRQRRVRVGNRRVLAALVVLVALVGVAWVVLG
ncbi:MAG: hypothetical protein ACRCYR_12490 [Phycicoccus sp.]